VTHPTVVVYTRAGCGLCRTVEGLVADVGDLDAQVVDVDQDPALQARYHLRVPVVLLDGVEVHDAGGDVDALRRLLRRGRRPWAGRNPFAPWRRFGGGRSAS
jgi:glutaredoxin